MSDHLPGRALPWAAIPLGLANISWDATHEIHHVRLITEAVIPVDKWLLPCGQLSWMVWHILNCHFTFIHHSEIEAKVNRALLDTEAGAGARRVLFPFNWNGNEQVEDYTRTIYSYGGDCKGRSCKYRWWIMWCLFHLCLGYFWADATSSPSCGMFNDVTFEQRVWACLWIYFRMTRIDCLGEKLPVLFVETRKLPLRGNFAWRKTMRSLLSLWDWTACNMFWMCFRFVKRWSLFFIRGH
jgi:hypothetical protein